MGGIGSGRRWHYDAKETTSDYRVIDVRRWHREGMLSPGQNCGWQWKNDGEIQASIQVRAEPNRVFLTYRHSRKEEEWTNKNYPVYLDWTKCHLGGERPWFLCPAKDCGRRVALLYCGGIFACRKCYQLAYQSQREVNYDRAARRADKIREKLNWEPGILNGKDWTKPKGMHWKTYEKLCKEHDYYVQFSLAGIATKLNLFGESIDN